MDCLRAATRSRFARRAAAGRLGDELGTGADHLVLGRRHRWDAGAIWRFITRARAADVDVIHSHGRGSMVFVSLAKRLGRLRAAHVFHDHLSGPSLGERPPRSVALAVRHAVDAYIGVSDELVTWARTWLPLPATAVYLIANGVDIDRFRHAGSATRSDALPGEGATLVVSVANLRPPKDYPTLLRAFGGAEIEGAHLVIVGADEPGSHFGSRCRALVHELGLDARVTFLGPRTDIPEILRQCDVGVIISTSEAGPTCLLEYVAAGIPFVSTDVGQYAAELAGTGAGLVVPVGDVAATTNALNELLALPSRQRKDRAALALELIRSRYSISRVVDDVVAVYAEVAPARAAS